MNNMMVRKMRWLLLIAVFFIFLGTLSPAFASSKDFEGLKGEGKSGKVKISVESYHETSNGFEKVPDTVQIKAGDKTSYIPVITNKGSTCNLRLKVYAKTKTQSINILKYCYGWEDNWDYKDGWFYYKKTFEKGDSVEICKGFEFPDEWQWRVSNVMGITVVAEAVADEDAKTSSTPKTGDDFKVILLVLALASVGTGLVILGRRKHGNKDI